MTKKQEYLLFLLWPFIILGVSLFLKPVFFETIFLFYILPALFLSWKLPGQIVKTAQLAFVGSLLGLIFDYSAEVTATWVFPQTYFSFKLLGVTPIEVPLWFFFWTYLVIMFYEYFLEQDKKREKIASTAKTLLWVGLVIYLTFYFLITVWRMPFAVPYTYLTFGVLYAFIPLVLMLYFYPKLRAKFLIVIAYFFLHSLVYEIVGLRYGSWSFPATSQFVGWIQLFSFKFPFEEFFFWITVASAGILAWYEFFDDDRK